MQRSQSLALMFLLGAVLVGGVLGFVADRTLHGAHACPAPGDVRTMRGRLAEHLALDPTQRTRLDSILDARSARISSVMQPVKPRLDAINDSARADIAAMLTPEQRQRYEQWYRDMKARQRHKSQR